MPRAPAGHRAARMRHRRRDMQPVVNGCAASCSPNRPRSRAGLMELGATVCTPAHPGAGYARWTGAHGGMPVIRRETAPEFSVGADGVGCDGVHARTPRCGLCPLDWCAWRHAGYPPPAVLAGRDGGSGRRPHDAGGGRTSAVQGIPPPGSSLDALTLSVLRSWLAATAGAGAARTTLAAGALRRFKAFHRLGELAHDEARRLVGGPPHPMRRPGRDPHRRARAGDRGSWNGGALVSWRTTKPDAS